MSSLFALITVKHRSWNILAFAFTFCLFFSRFSSGQVFRHFTEKDGTPYAVALGITKDKVGYMWFATNEGLLRYDSQTFKKYKHTENDPSSIPSNSVQSVYNDAKGNLWIGTWRGLSLYDRAKDVFVTYSHDKNNERSLSGELVYVIREDKKGQIWVGTSGGLDLLRQEGDSVWFEQKLPVSYQGNSRRVRSMEMSSTGEWWIGTYAGLIRLNPETNQSKLFKREGDVDLEDNEFVSVFIDKHVGIWLGCNGEGLVHFDPVKERFSIVESLKTGKGDFPNVSGVVSEGNGYYWIITESGLVRFNPFNHEVKWFVNDPSDTHSLVDNILYSMYLDNEGGLWLGSYYLGISYCNINGVKFEKIPPGFPDISNCWMGVLKNGDQWFVNYERSRLWLFDKNDVLLSTTHLRIPNAGNVYGFYVDEERGLWCGSSSFLYRIDAKSGAIREYPLVISSTGVPKSGRVRRILDAPDGKLWIGGAFGLLKFDKKSGSFQDFPDVDRVVAMHLDTEGKLWAGNSKVLYHEVAGRDEFEAVIEDIPGQAKVLEWLYSITEDPERRIWLVTSRKLLRYDPVQRKVEYFPMDEIPEVLLDLQIDLDGYLWISTASKLYRWHPETENIQTYSYRDGLPVNGILQSGSTIKDADGILYYITNNSAFRVNPKDVRVHQESSPLIWTRLRLSHREVRPGDGTGILSNVIEQSGSIKLRHTQNTFSLDFALLSYFDADGNRYSYQLEGFDKDWQETELGTVSYTNLPPGNYTMKVKAANGDGVWNPEPLTLTIKVLPPWWQSWYAYLLYTALVGVIIFGVLRFLWMRTLLRRDTELYHAKIEFFTNLSHEIRTHLSLVSGPLEYAYNSSAESEKARGYLELARRNSNRLMILVNELLDFRKIQSGRQRLKVSEQDMVKLIKGVVPAFEHLAREKEINTTLLLPDGPVKVWVDVVNFQKVMYNLLGNAYKFTPAGGSVTVSMVERVNEIEIFVEDNGPGIAEEYLKDVFLGFFQTGEYETHYQGYGIGLALSKEIVERHKGYLKVTSRKETPEKNGKTCFSVCLLKGHQHFNPEDIVGQGVVPAVAGGPAVDSGGVRESDLVDKSRRRVLLIEDNDELRLLTGDFLSSFYTVLQAANGEAGLEIARQQLPDLIICDVMMPEMNGLDFCRAIRNDMVTSHIPVVILTARNTTEQQLEGLSVGADDYLVKPISLEVLKLKIDNQIRSRDELRRKLNFRNIEGWQGAGTDLDDKFIEQIKTIIMDNLSNPEFGVNEIAFQIGISVSVLYRKLRALTGMTVNELMKMLRMQAAGRLLESGNYQVNEVATMVGFDDTKYFSKEFKKVFGKRPSQFRKEVGQA